MCGEGGGGAGSAGRCGAGQQWEIEMKGEGPDTQATTVRSATARGSLSFVRCQSTATTNCHGTQEPVRYQDASMPNTAAVAEGGSHRQRI